MSALTYDRPVFPEYLFNRAQDTIIHPEIYAKEVDNVVTEYKITSRMSRLKKANLIGCLNDSGVTSKNYKNFLYDQ